MSVRVKICGVNSAAAFDAVIDAGADWVGFVFFARSPRCVTPAEAAALSARRPGGPPRVGLFVDPGEAEIAAVLAEMKLDILQLYAPRARVLALRAAFGVPVWQAIGIAGAADLPTEAAGIDGFLLDARPAPDATRPGGNAAAFDWRLLSGWKSPAPWLLAGGLAAENVGEAVRISGAPAVDVSSGVETAPGRKDPGLIRAFIAAARAA